MLTPILYHTQILMLTQIAVLTQIWVLTWTAEPMAEPVRKKGKMNPPLNPPWMVMEMATIFAAATTRLYLSANGKATCQHLVTGRPMTGQRRH